MFKLKKINLLLSILIVIWSSWCFNTSTHTLGKSNIKLSAFLKKQKKDVFLLISLANLIAGLRGNSVSQPKQASKSQKLLMTFSFWRKTNKKKKAAGGYANWLIRLNSIDRIIKKSKEQKMVREGKKGEERGSKL